MQDLALLSLLDTCSHLALVQLSQAQHSAAHVVSQICLAWMHVLFLYVSAILSLAAPYHVDGAQGLLPVCDNMMHRASSPHSSLHASHACLLACTHHPGRHASNTRPHSAHMHCPSASSTHPFALPIAPASARHRPHISRRPDGTPPRGIVACLPQWCQTCSSANTCTKCDNWINNNPGMFAYKLATASGSVICKGELVVLFRFTPRPHPATLASECHTCRTTLVRFPPRRVMLPFTFQCTSTGPACCFQYAHLRSSNTTTPLPPTPGGTQTKTNFPVPRRFAEACSHWLTGDNICYPGLVRCCRPGCSSLADLQLYCIPCWPSSPALRFVPWAQLTIHASMLILPRKRKADMVLTSQIQALYTIE